MNRKLLMAIGWLVWTAAGLAHDSGFGHSRRAIFVTAEPKQVIIEYRITMNRDEALIELAGVDRDRDGKVSTEESTQHFTNRGKVLAGKLHLCTAANEHVPLRFVSFALRHPLCQVYRFSAATGAGELLLDDQNFPYKPGQVRIVAGAGVKVELAKPADLSHAERVQLKITRTKETPK